MSALPPKSGHVQCTSSYPLWANSGLTHRSKIELLFNQLIGALLKRHWYVSPERLGGLDVDHQFELDRGLDGKSARLFALEDAIDIRCRAPIRIVLVNSVGQQAAEFSEGAARIDGREAGKSC